MGYSKSKNIYCPKCGRTVIRWDGKFKSQVSAKCSRCKKLVVFNPEEEDDKKVVIKPLPQRVSASGMRYY